MWRDVLAACFVENRPGAREICSAERQDATAEIGNLREPRQLGHVFTGQQTILDIGKYQVAWPPIRWQRDSSAGSIPVRGALGRVAVTVAQIAQLLGIFK